MTPGQKFVGTNTIFFIPRHNVLADSKVTYANFICDVCPLNEEAYRVKLTVSGDKLNYCSDPSSRGIITRYKDICEHCHI